MKQNQLTPDQIAELRRLLRNRQNNPETPISYTLKIAMFEALPDLLAAAEREQKLEAAINHHIGIEASLREREAKLRACLTKLLDLAERKIDGPAQYGQVLQARAALAEGGAK